MKNKLFKITFVLVTIFQIVNGQDIDKINKLFEKYNNVNSPGVAVTVIKDGKVIHNKGYGIANLEYGIPITPTTVFHIGSVSKQFTAFAILLLESQGKLSLNDFIGIYLEDLPEFKNRIKIKHLLHHTSGLREIETLQQIAGITTADQIGSDALYNLIKNQKDLNFIPGEELEYTNTGYFLLAKIVEKVTGNNFSDWTSVNIFVPLEMNRTVFYDDCTVIINNRAYPYWNFEDELIKGILSYSYVGPTSVMTTGEDMTKWLMNFSDIKVGNYEIINRMLSETDTLNSGEPIDYGYGIGVTDYKGLKVVLHSGHDAAYRAADLYFPEYKMGIALLSNYYSINPMHSGFEIADIILKDFIEEETVTSNEEEERAEGQEYTKAYNLSPDELSEFQGNYVCNELGIQYNLTVRNDTLIAKFWRNQEVILSVLQSDSFEGDAYWFRNLKFIRDDNKKIEGFSLSAGRVRNLMFKRVFTE
jgi:CubicO group peptidase (beta-lactamase class C family)